MSNLEFEGQDNIDRLFDWVFKVTKALGHPEAFVSDQSVISDFTHTLGFVFTEDGIGELSDEDYEKVMNKYLSDISSKLNNIPVDHNDYIWQVAERYRDSFNQQ